MAKVVAPASYNDLLAEDSVLELIYGWMQLWERYFSAGPGPRHTDSLLPSALGTTKNSRFLSDHLRTLPSSLPYRRCLLISGPTGVGKTLLAKYLASAFGYTPIVVDCIDEEDTRIYDSVFGNHMSSLMTVAKKAIGPGTGTKKLLILDNIDCFIDHQYQSSIMQRLTAYDRKLRLGTLHKSHKRQHPIILLAADAYARSVRKFRDLSAVVNLGPPSLNKIVAVFQKHMDMHAGISTRSFFSKAVLATGSDVRTLNATLELVFHHKCITLDAALNKLLQNASSSYINLARAVATQNYSFLIESSPAQHGHNSDQGLSQFLRANNLNTLDRSARSTAVLVAMLSFLGYSTDEFERAMHRLEDHALEIGLIQQQDLSAIIRNSTYLRFLTAISSAYQFATFKVNRMLALSALVQLNTDLLQSPLPLKMHDNICNSLLYPASVRLGNVAQIRQHVPESYYTTVSPLGLASIGARSSTFVAEILPFAVAMVSLGTSDIGNLLIMPSDSRLSTINLAATAYDAGLTINMAADSADSQAQHAPVPAQFGNDTAGYNFPISASPVWQRVYRRIPANGLHVLESMRERLVSSMSTWKSYENIDASIEELFSVVEDEIAAESRREAGLLEKDLVYVYNDGVTTAVRRPVIYSSLWEG